MLLLDTAAEEEQRTKVLAEAERILESNSATIVSKHDWGVRRTAFEIRHKNDAEYHLLQFQGGPEVPPRWIVTCASPMASSASA